MELTKNLALSTMMAALILLPSCARLELKREMKRFMASEIELPVYLDTEHDFRRLNPSIPDDVRFHSFFLDESGHPILIGDPSGSARMMSLLEKRASMEVPETSDMSVDGVFALRKYCLDVAGIGVLEVGEAMERAGISLVGSGLGVFIPPYVCGECLSQEVEILRSLEPASLFVVAPESRADAFCKEFSGMPEVEVLSYPEASMSGCDAASFDGVIYFRVSDSHVKEVYLSNREAPEATEVFIKKLW